MRNRTRNRGRLLRLEQLEQRCLLSSVTLAAGEWYCPGTGFYEGDTSESLISHGQLADPSPPSRPLVCVFNEGPGTIEADVGAETAELWAVEGDTYSVVVTGLNGAAGNAVWHGDAGSLKLDATGTIGPVAVSGNALLQAGGDILQVQAAEVTAEAGGSIGDVTAEELVQLRADSVGRVHVSGDAKQIEVEGVLEAVTVGGDLHTLVAGISGPIYVGQSGGRIEIRREFVSTLYVGADLGALWVGADLDAAVQAEGEVGEVRVDGDAKGSVSGGGSIGTVVVRGNADIELSSGGDLGLLSLGEGGRAGVRARGALGALSAGGRASLEVSAGRAGPVVLEKGGVLSMEVGTDVGLIEAGGDLEVMVRTGQLGTLRADGALQGHVQATATVGTVRGTRAAGLELSAARIEGVSLEDGGSLTIHVGTLDQLTSGGDVVLTGVVDQDLGAVDAGGALSVRLRVGKAVGSVGAAGTVSGLLVAGSADALESQADWLADVQIDGGLQHLRSAGSIDATVQAHRVGAVTAGGDVSGELLVDTDVDLLHAGSDLRGDVRIGGGLGTLEVGGGLTGAVYVEGSVGKVAVGGSLTGTLQIGPVQEAILVGQMLSGTVQSGELPLLVVGQTLDGAIAVDGRAGDIRVGWDFAEWRPAAGRVERSSIQVRGDLNRLIVHGGDDRPGDVTGVTLTVDGRLRLLDATGDFEGSVRVRKAVGAVRAGGDMSIELEAGARLEELIAGGDLRLQGDIGGPVAVVRSRGALWADLTANGTVGRIEAADGDLSARVEAAGSVGEIAAAGSANLTVKSDGAVGTILVGASGGGNLAARLQAADGVELIVVADEVARGATAATAPELSRLQPPDENARVRQAPALPKRPKRPDRFEHGSLGNADIEIVSPGRVGKIITAGNLALSLAVGSGVERIWAGGDLRGIVEADKSEGKLLVDGWGKADVVLRTSGSVEIAAYDGLHLVADVGGELIAGAWGPVAVSSLQADSARVWSFGPAEVVADTRESLQVAGLDTVELTAGGTGDISVGAYDSLLARITGTFVSTALSSFGDLTVSWTSPAGKVFLYGLGNVNATIPDAADVSVTAWGDFAGDVRATGDVQLAALGTTTGSIQADGSIQIETAGHSGPVTAGDALVVDAHGNWTGDLTAQNFVHAYVHGDLDGNVAGRAGDVELDVSRAVQGDVEAGANVSVSAGSFEGSIRAGGAVDVEIHGVARGDITAGRWLRAKFWNDFTGEVTAAGTAWVESYGNFAGTLRGAEEIRAVVAGNFTGAARAQSVLPQPVDGPRGQPPGLMLYVYGDVRGDLFAEGDLAVTALGSFDGVATARFGRAELTVAAQSTGTIVAGRRVALRAGGPVQGSIRAQGAATVEALDDVTLEVDADELSLAADSVAVTVGEAARVWIWAREDAQVTATGAVSELRADADGKLTLSGGNFGLVRAYGATNASVRADHLGDALISSWGRVQLAANGGRAVEVRGDEISIGGASTSLIVRTPGKVSGNWVAEQSIDIQAVGPVVGTYQASGSLIVQSGDFVQGSFDAGQMLEVDAVRDVQGTFRSGGGGRVRSVAGSFKGEASTDLDLLLTVAGDVKGTLDAGGSLLVAAGRTIQGDVRADKSITVRVLGDMDGTVDSGASVYLSVGGAFSGNLRAGDGATIVVVRDWEGPANTGGELAAAVGGNWSGDIDAGASVSVEALGAVFADVSAAQSIALATGAEFQGRLTAGGDIRVRSGGDVSGAFTADGQVTIETLRDIQADIEAQGSIYTASNGQFKGAEKAGGAVTLRAWAGVQGTITAVHDALVAALGPVQATIRADDVSVWTGSDMSIDVRATGSVALIGYGPQIRAILDAQGSLDAWTLGNALLVGRVAGAAELSSFGELVVDLDVGAHYASFSLGKATLALRSGGDASVTALAGAYLDLQTQRHAIATALGDLAGAVRAAGEVLTATWSSFTGLAIEAQHDVAAIALRGSTIDARSNNGNVDVWVYEGGAVLGNAAERMQVLSGADAAVTVRGAADAVLLVDGTLGLIMKGVTNASVQATGAIDANVQDTDQVRFVAETDFGGYLSVRELSVLIGGTGRVEMNDVGALTSAVSVDSLSLLGNVRQISQVLTGGQLELALDVGGCEDLSASSTAGYGPTEGAPGSAEPTKCGVVDELLAREDITGEVSAAWAINSVRAGERVLASLRAPFVGTVVSYDPTLRAMQLPAVEVDVAALREDKKRLENLRSELAKAVEAVRTEAQRLREQTSEFVGRRLAEMEADAEGYDREVELRRGQIQDERERRLAGFQSGVGIALEQTERALAEFVQAWNRLRADAESNREQVRAADADVEKRLARFVTQRRMEAVREKFAHDTGYEALLSLRTSAAQQRPDRWVEAFYEAVDEVLANVQFVGGIASYVPGPVGTVGYAIHLGTSLLRGDWFATGGDVLSAIARASARRHPWLAGSAISAMFDVASYLTSEDEPQSGSSEELSGDLLVEEPACFVAGTLVALVRPFPPAHATAAWSELAMITCVASAATFAIWRQPANEPRLRCEPRLVGPEHLVR